MQFAQSMMRGGDRTQGYNQSSESGHPLFGLVIVLILAGIAIYLIRTIAQAKSQKNTVTEARTPLDIAKERFAKGEISKTELSDIKKELK